MRSLLFIVCCALASGCAWGGGDPQNDASVVGPDGEISACTLGLTQCMDECVDTRRNPDHCGQCSNECNAGLVCYQSRCEPPGPCGTEGCEGFAYCDTATGRCEPGCTEDAECPVAEVCDVPTHSCVCVSGRHRCSGLCELDTSPDSCGERCEPCPGVPNGTPICSAGACSIACQTGYVYCGGTCMPEVQEACNGTDDNCNGAIDEGCTSGAGSCTSPFAVPASGGSQMHSISGVGRVTAPCAGRGDDGIEMVYQWIPSRTGSAIFTTSATNFWPTALYVRTGSCEGTEIACAASLEMEAHPTVTVTAPVSAGVPYYIVVDSSHNTDVVLTATLTVTGP